MNRGGMAVGGDTIDFAMGSVGLGIIRGGKSTPDEERKCSEAKQTTQIHGVTFLS